MSDRAWGLTLTLADGRGCVMSMRRCGRQGAPRTLAFSPVSGPIWTPLEGLLAIPRPGLGRW